MFTAQELAHAVKQHAQDRAVVVETDIFSPHHEFAAALRTICACPVGERSVVASIADNHYGRIFGYSCAESLDCAAADTFPDDLWGEIAELSRTCYRITW